MTHIAKDYFIMSHISSFDKIHLSTTCTPTEETVGGEQCMQP